MKKMLLATALALLLQDVLNRRLLFKQTGSSSTKKTITHHFFVSELGRKHRAAKICGGAENVVKEASWQTFVEALGFITLGIYTPLEARVYCSQ